MVNRRTRISAAIAALGAGTLCAAVPALAQQTQQLERVEITGSALRRVDAETALPVTILKAEELRALGITTGEQVIQRIASSQSNLSIAQGIGATTGGQSIADLRGLGGNGNKTLVLLNGRRIANHAYDSGSVDLNAIPVEALDRVEILRDGASAIYGTDAIGGVINFILRRDYQGVQAGAGYEGPQQGGGSLKQANLTVGYGALDKEGFNAFATVNFRSQAAIKSTDRTYASTGLRLDRGLANVSPTTFPASISQAQGADTVAGNPFAPNCAPPNSVPLPEFGVICAFDFTRFIDLLPENEQLSFVAKGSLRLARDHTLGLEYVRSENKTIVRVAPTPVTQLTMPAGHPFYPGGPGSSVPAVPGIDITQPITVNWRTIPAGQRTNEPVNTTERVLLDGDGLLAGWDYRTGVSFSRNQVNEEFTDGYVKRPYIAAGVGGGNIPGTATPAPALNPFGNQTPAGTAYLLSSKVLGEVIEAKGEVTALDGRISRDIAQLPAGPLAMALGLEFRKEEFFFDLKEDLVRQAASSGLELAQDVSGDRDVIALFTEFNIPIVKNFDAQFALRYDRYSDFGNTVNPKVALRYQPTKEVLLRSSYNRGFRAPSLYEIYQPAFITNTANAYNDPVLCPDGVPAPGADPNRDCQIQFNQQLAGSRNLDPEKSRTIAFGAVFEPVQGTTFSVDLWDLRLKDQINGLPEQAVFLDPTKYASRFVRCSQVDATLRASIDACNNPGAVDPLAYINTPNENLGEIRTRGVDLGFSERFPRTDYGTFSVTVEGTYVDKYDYQRERGGAFVNNAGRYVDAGPIFRWQHALTVGWSMGPYSVSLANRYKSKYTDENSPLQLLGPEYNNVVSKYSVWDTSFTYTGVKNLSATLGVINIFDEDPPFSNQSATFQGSYDPRFTDVRGRTFMTRLSYRFL
jgi:iron complex outermembrane receptor protein